MSAASPLREHRLNFGGYSTRALIRPGHGPTVLFLHGFATSADAWRPLFAAMTPASAAPANLVALDLPGFGQGPLLTPHPAPMLPQMLAFASAAVMYCATDGPLWLVGHSLGGRTALAAAANPDSPIAGVIALAPAPLRLRRWLQLIAAERAVLPRVLPLLRLLPDRFMAQRFARGYRRSFHAPDAVDPEAIARMLDGCDAARVANLAQALHRIGGELGDTLDLSHLSAPVDLVWGDHDRLAPAAAAKAYRDRLPQARYHEISDCGHEIALEQPELVARLLAERLSTLDKKPKPRSAPSSSPPGNR